MGEKIENGTIHVGEIIGKTLDGRDIYKFTELGMAENVKIIEPQYKDGDFVVNEAGSILIFREEVGDSIYDHAFLVRDLMLFTNPVVPSFHGIKRYATEAEKQELLDALAKKWKRWNEEKLCIEDIPKRKFKSGDKVRIKEGISSKTHGSALPNFRDSMDEFIGRKLTIDMYTSEDRVIFSEDERGWRFSEDWLEPYVEELKKGDLAIFWDDSKEHAIIRFYDRPNESGEYFRHKDQNGSNWKNAIKFESKEQYERLIKGEI